MRLKKCQYIRKVVFGIWVVSGLKAKPVPSALMQPINTKNVPSGKNKMSTEEYDPIKEINEADLCMHCIHHNICYLEREFHKLADTYSKHRFGFGLHRKLDEFASSCKCYKRKIL